MDSLGYFNNFEFINSQHTRFTAHVAFEHAKGRSMSNVAKEFGISQNKVLIFYRRICRYIYREIRWHISHGDEFSEFERIMLLDFTNKVLYDTTFRHPTGIKLIEKYYLYICEQEKNNPEKSKNWIDEVERIPSSQDEINRKKVNQLLARLKTRHDNLIENAKAEYEYLTNLIQNIIEPKKNEDINENNKLAKVAKLLHI